MIDLDQMDEQLTSAVTDAARSGRRPAPLVATAPTRPPASPRRRHAAPAAPPAGRERRRAQVSAVPRAAAEPPRPPAGGGSVRELLELGRLEEIDARIAASTDPCDVATWTTMRALLDGRQDVVRSGIELLASQTKATGDPAASERYWAQRFWAAVEWGDQKERYDVLDHCRERAYRFDEPAWWGNLTLLLATLGNADEGARAFDAVFALVDGAPRDGVWLDVATNLIEAAALLGDSSRATLVHRTAPWPGGRLVVVGPGAVCKGSIERYRALGFAAAGMWEDAADCFRAAVSVHRLIGAAPLLARTVAQANQARIPA